MKISVSFGGLLFAFILESTIPNGVHTSAHGAKVSRVHHLFTRETESSQQEGKSNVRIGDRPVFAKFVFDKCGNEKEHSVHVQRLELDPNPMQIPGNVTFNVAAQFTDDVSSPLAVQLEMEKKLPMLFGSASWFKIPCFPNGFGSCLHDDLCDVRIFKESGCVDPETENLIECSCPFKKDTVYHFKPTTYKIPALPPSLPSYLLEGEILVRAILLKEDKEVGCYQSEVEMNV